MFGGELSSPHKSMIWFPVVGLILGYFSYRLLLPLSTLFPSLLTALFLVLFQAWASRGLHLDGLADLSDALFSNKDKEGMLGIMKDPTLGTFGVLSLVFAVALKWQLLAYVLTFEKSFVFLALLGSMMLSRFAQGWMAARFDYARVTGTGLGFIGGAKKSDGYKTLFITLLIAALLLKQIFILALVTILFVAFFGGFLTKKLGGITGDCLGATSELTEIIILISVVILQHLQYTSPKLYEYLS